MRSTVILQICSAFVEKRVLKNMVLCDFYTKKFILRVFVTTFFWAEDWGGELERGIDFEKKILQHVHSVGF